MRSQRVGHDREAHTPTQKQRGVSGRVCLRYTHLTSRLQSSGGWTEAVPETDVGQQLALSSHNQHDGLGGFSMMGAFVCLVQTIQVFWPAVPLFIFPLCGPSSAE